MKKFLIACCFSFAIFADPSFYDLVKSNQSSSSAKAFATDLSTKNDEQSLVEQVASLLYSKDADTAKKTIESTALKKPGLWQRMANKVKGFFGYGETASTNQANSLNDLQALMQNKSNVSSGNFISTLVANGYQKLKKSNPALVESVTNYLLS
jgi:hypothetical protein